MFRVSGLFMFAPMFGSDLVPTIVKVFLSFSFALLFFPTVQVPADLRLESNLGLYLFQILSEFAVGAIIAFVALMIFNAVQIGGQIIDTELGIGLINIIDPITQEQVSIIAQFKLFLAMLVFIVISGHHQLIIAISSSFQAIPVASVKIESPLVTFVSDSLVKGLFINGLRIAAPVLVTSLVTSVGLAFMSRAFPQFNVFIAGFNLRIIGGLIILMVIISSFVIYFSEETINHFQVIKQTINLMKP